MGIKYLNYSQAKAICSDYQYLVGAQYDKGGEETVQQVVMAPYSRILQWQFVHSILRGVSHQEALSINPNGRYDVLVLPKQDYRGLHFRTKRLRDYLEEHNITYHQENYNCLRSF